MNTLWLGYDGLTVLYLDVAAVLHYRPALNMRIIQAYGDVPLGVQTVVVTTAGAYLPARWRMEYLRQSWAKWREHYER